MHFIEEINGFVRTLRIIDAIGFFWSLAALGAGFIFMFYEEIRLGLVAVSVGVVIWIVYKFIVGIGFTVLSMAHKANSPQS